MAGPGGRADGPADAVVVGAGVRAGGAPVRPHAAAIEIRPAAPSAHRDVARGIGESLLSRNMRGVVVATVLGAIVACQPPAEQAAAPRSRPDVTVPPPPPASSAAPAPAPSTARSPGVALDQALYCDQHVQSEGDAIPPKTGSFRPASPKPEIRKPEDIQKLVREKYDLFRRCYETALARDANLKGKVTVRFVIDREGATQDVCVKEATLTDAAAVRCMLDAYRTLRFAPAPGQTTVVYPIEFSPG